MIKSRSQVEVIEKTRLLRLKVEVATLTSPALGLPTVRFESSRLRAYPTLIQYGQVESTQTG